MEHSFDLVVVGAGPGGCLAAKTAAKGGLKVCLIEAKPAEYVGLKACGDAVGKHHFDNIGLRYPKGSELCWELRGVKIVSPDGEVVFNVEGAGAKAFLLDRKEFGKRLVKEALDAGAELMDETTAIEPIVEDDRIIAVRVTGKRFRGTIRGRVFVDASGVSAVLRRKAPETPGFERTVDKRDLELAYRELRILEEGLEDVDYGYIYLTQRYAPGGYFWLFPKGVRTVNTGLGVQAVEGNPNPRISFTRFIDDRLPYIARAKVLDGRGAYVPTRRPLDNMVSNGLLVVGDAACQVNPIHGGGIGPAMTAGKLAGETVLEALEKGDVSYKGLWSYNVKHMRGYGSKQASLDVFRMLLQSLSDEDLNYGMSRGLISEEEVLKASMQGEVKLTITEKVLQFLRSIGRLSLIVKLKETAALMKLVKNHYQVFPEDPDEYPGWLRETRRLFDEARKIVGLRKA
ncbi:geranylgeranyl reductase family protein [Candidatus Bathyarchaeota archaeon]|nr:geranylgeranyl reductase family protein [Candidatus Bathyarchaeota archaeon]